MTLRKQGAKFKFIVSEGKPDILYQIVLYIFLDKRGLPKPQTLSENPHVISRCNRLRQSDESIAQTREKVFSNSIKASVNLNDSESLLETLNLHKKKPHKIDAETFLNCLTLTRWGCFFLRETQLLPYIKAEMLKKKNSVKNQKKVLIVLSQVGRNPLGAELLSEHPDLLEFVLNKLDQRKMFSLDAFVFQFANLLVKNEKGRTLLVSKRFDWSVKFISKKKINQAQDKYVAIHK